MKVRWNRSSLRLRITPDELAALERGEGCEERMGIPGGFVMRLEPAEVTALDSSGGVVRFGLSKADLARLSAPEVEGAYFQAEVRYYRRKGLPVRPPSGGGSARDEHGDLRPLEHASPIK